MASKDVFVMVKKKRKNFRWSDEMTENLVGCILTNKSKYYSNSIDFYVG